MADSRDEDQPTTGVTFTVALRGYDRREVNEYITALTERVNRQSAALRLAEERLSELDNGGSVNDTGPDREPLRDDDVETVLTDALAQLTRTVRTHREIVDELTRVQRWVTSDGEQPASIQRKR
jgi:hypothetical protein